jgi:phosphoribosylglycinamide formyltransferase 2
LLVDGDSNDIRFENVERALVEPDTTIRLFGKPEVRGHRRMGVSLALGESIEAARAKARAMTQTLLDGVRCR